MRLIDADKLYEEHTRLAYEGDYAFHITARAWLEKQPTVDAVPVVRHGRWILGQTMGHSWMKCSECCVSQDGQTATFTYCPNCGAKMDGGADDDDN